MASLDSSAPLSLRVWLVPAWSLCCHLDWWESSVGKAPVLASSLFLLPALLVLEIWRAEEGRAHFHAYKQLNFSRNSCEILANAGTFQEVKDTLVSTPIWAIKICSAWLSLSVCKVMPTGWSIVPQMFFYNPNTKSRAFYDWNHVNVAPQIS